MQATVTQQHIDEERTTRHGSSCDPVTRAFRGLDIGVHIDADGGWYFLTGDGERRALPNAIKKFLRRWDAGHELQPFTALLDEHARTI